MGNLFYILGFLAAIICLIFFLNTFFKKINIVLLILLSIALFFGEYIVFSSLLLTWDRFYVSYGLLLTLILNVILLVIRRKNLRGITTRVTSFTKRLVAVLLIVGICTAFTALKTENIEASNDAGAYSTKAIDMMYGANTSSTEVIEYATGNEAVKESSRALLAHSYAFYQEVESFDEGKLTFQYHAYPAWPAVLALWGTMFGIYNMGGILTLLFICAALAMFFIVDKFAKNKWAAFLSLALFAFAPLNITLFKNFLSEPVYITMMLTSILLLIQKSKPVKHLALFPMAALPFLHLFTFVYSPMVFAMLLYTDFKKKDTTHTKIGIVFNLFVAFGLYYGTRVSGMYTNGQLSKMFGTNRSFDTLLLIAGIVIIIMILIQIIYIYWQKHQSMPLTKLENTMTDKFTIILRVIVIALLVACVVKGYLLCFTNYYPTEEGTSWRFRTYAGTGLSALPYLNFFVGILCTSLVCIPYILYRIFRKKATFSIVQKVFFLMLCYSMLVMFILYTDSPLLYVTARYFAIFFMPAVFILVGLLVENIKAIIAFIITTVAFALPFNIAQAGVRETQGRYAWVQHYSGTIPENAVVVLDNGLLAAVLSQNLREINHNLVYHSDVIDEVIKMYPDQQIYFVSLNDLQSDDRFVYVNEVTVDKTGYLYSFNGMFPLELDEVQSVRSYLYYIQEGSDFSIPY